MTDDTKAKVVGVLTLCFILGVLGIFAKTVETVIRQRMAAKKATAEAMTLTNKGITAPALGYSTSGHAVEVQTSGPILLPNVIGTSTFGLDHGNLRPEDLPSTIHVAGGQPLIVAGDHVVLESAYKSKTICIEAGEQGVKVYANRTPNYRDKIYTPATVAGVTIGYDESTWVYVSPHESYIFAVQGEQAWGMEGPYDGGLCDRWGKK